MRWLLYTALGIVALQRLVEIVVSRRNQLRLVNDGGHVVEDAAYPWIVAVHVLWFPAIFAEATWAPWGGAWTGTWALIGAYLAAEGLRLWAISSLGDRWTTRVVVKPGAKLVDEGPYRFLDHPNYVAVGIELAVLPLAFGAPATAIAATVVNALALRIRIRTEEEALAQATSADA